MHHQPNPYSSNGFHPLLGLLDLSLLSTSHLLLPQSILMHPAPPPSSSSTSSRSLPFLQDQAHNASLIKWRNQAEEDEDEEEEAQKLGIDAFLGHATKRLHPSIRFVPMPQRPSQLNRLLLWSINNWIESLGLIWVYHQISFILPVDRLWKKRLQEELFFSFSLFHLLDDQTGKGRIFLDVSVAVWGWWLEG